jgi:transposase
MDFKIRTTKTKSGNTAIQVINYVKRKTIVLKHIGSASNETEKDLLEKQAYDWILNYQNENSLFKNEFKEIDAFNKTYKYLGVKIGFAYEFLGKIYDKFNFNKHTEDLLKYLVLTQILEPSSKRSAVRFLEEKIGMKFNLTSVYNSMIKHDSVLKDSIEKETIQMAKEHFGFDFSFVLYDVTTLYFESFKNDEFKRPGFSKDHKNNQPQIVIGLIVTKDGFPVHYEVFKGNTFEGNTFLPILIEFKKKYGIESLTVVADSAMFSKLNFDKLKECGINYIVGARLSNQKKEVLDKIEKDIKKEHGYSIKIDELIVEYSKKRYSKDKKEMEKQIERARKYENVKTVKITKLKFLKNDKTKYTVDQKLIDKNSKLLGLKGYTTNLTLPNGEIIGYYHNLFKVEHAFRISKSDLEMRPIYHYKEESIKNHILICFMCLAISVYLEIKTKYSIKEIVHKIKGITDAQMKTKITGKVLSVRSELSTEVKEIMRLSY